MAGKKKRKPKFQPTKYDWTALESEYLTGEISSVAEFCRIRSISMSQWKRKTLGWGQKRDAVRLHAHKALRNGWLKDAVNALKDKLQINLNVSSGMMKTGVDALIPNQATGYAGMKPKSATEASRMIELATRIERNTLQTMSVLGEALQDKVIDIPGASEGTTQNLVIIDLPRNGKESKELPGK